jgi:hypothetical protein
LAEGRGKHNRGAAIDIVGDVNMLTSLSLWCCATRCGEERRLFHDSFRRPRVITSNSSLLIVSTPINVDTGRRVTFQRLSPIK